MRNPSPLWNQLIHLTFKSRVSLQAQIREMLVAAILEGQIPLGAALPSTRVLARQLGVARNTVALAYELLVNEGYLETKNRSGHYVNPEIVAGRAVARPRTLVHVPLAPMDWQRRIASSPRASATSSSRPTGRNIPIRFYTDSSTRRKRRFPAGANAASRHCRALKRGPGSAI